MMFCLDIVLVKDICLDECFSEKKSGPGITTYEGVRLKYQGSIRTKMKEKLHRSGTGVGA